MLSTVRHKCIMTAPWLSASCLSRHSSPLQLGVTAKSSSRLCVSPLFLSRSFRVSSTLFTQLPSFPPPPRQPSRSSRPLRVLLDLVGSGSAYASSLLFVGGLAVTFALVYPLRHSDSALPVLAILSTVNAAVAGSIHAGLDLRTTSLVTLIACVVVLGGVVLVNTVEHPNSLEQQILTILQNNQRVQEQLGSPVTRMMTRTITYKDRPAKKDESLTGRVCECTMFVRGSRYDGHVYALYNKPSLFTSWEPCQVVVSIEETGEKIMVLPTEEEMYNALHS